MYYDADLLEIMKDNQTQRYIVIYNGIVLGTVKDPQEAHYLATDYAIGSAMMREDR